MKKYLLTLFSVLVSVTLMGQTSFTNSDLVFTRIDNTTTAKVKRVQNVDRNILNIPETCIINDIQCTVVEIESQGFYQVNGLQKVTIPSTITTIGSKAFRSCSNLKEVTINGENLSTIGNEAFYQCGALAEIFIPGSVTSVGTEAFAYCSSLHEVRFGAPTSDNLPITLGQGAFKNCHNMHSISLPKNLTAIPDNLLSDCHGFNEIIIPENVTTVGAYAFQNTHDCEIIFLGCGNCGVITIHSTAFQNCHDEDIEFLCLDYDITIAGGVDWKERTSIHIPCGSTINYGTDSDVTLNPDDNCISVSRKSGQFCLPETWKGYDAWILTNDANGYSQNVTYQQKETWLQTYGYPYFVPRRPDHPFYIKEGDTVTLNHSRHIYPFNSINKGVLVVNSPKGGELIERDSIIFNGLYTLDVKYEVTKEDGQIFITRNGHDKRNITELINASNGTLVGNEYEKERNIYIRNIKTQELIPLGLFSDISENEIVTILSNDLTEHDYYELSPSNNNVLNYYGPYTDGGNQWNMNNGLPNFGLVISSPNFNQELQQKALGLYNDGDYVWHVFTYEGKKTAAKIEKSTGNVTLHGTDYAYGHVKMHENLGGEIEIVVPIEGNAWNFVGAPFKGYDLWGLKLGPENTDATVIRFDYTTNDWSMSYSYANDEIGAGEGLFVWPFYNDSIVFSTVKDLSTPSVQQQSKVLEKDFLLNNDDVVVKKTISVNPNVANDTKGRWMALSNPYPAKLCVNSFVEDNSNTIYDYPEQSNATIQGEGVYVLKYDNNGNQDWQFKPKTYDNAKKYDIGVGEGFFVNVVSSGENTITFKKNQLHEYDESTCVHEGHTHSAKAVEKEFIRFAMIEGERESEVLFAHNQDAQEGYDIFDANKLFAMSHIAEPYFVVDGIKLVKEEVNLLPYYATMNVKSFGNKEVKFRPNYIPEGLSVTLIDGEESIDLLQGQEYATEISAGENANRFKLLIKKSLGLSDAEELEVNISNDNRIVNIATSETDLQIEVYNALGQKVFETKALNFSLNNVSAGAYMIKAFNNKASKTQKIVVK